MQLFNIMRTGHLKIHYLKFGFSALSLFPALGICMILFIDNYARAEEFFNPSFLSDDPDAVADLSRFEKGEGQAPGKYRVEIYVNDVYQSTKDVNFISYSKDKKDSQENAENAADDTGLQACFTLKQFEQMGFNPHSLPGLKEMAQDKCFDFVRKVPHAISRFDFEKQRLYISIPQAAMTNNVRGYIPPDEWDEGIPALLLDYNFTGSNTHNKNVRGTPSNYFLSLKSGINLGAWRLRNYSTWNYSKQESKRLTS